MSKTRPFDEFALEYDEWFDRNRSVFESELLALREIAPVEGRGVEIGAGSGRFAQALGIRIGVEPSPRMNKLAAARGVKAVGAVAESLPFLKSRFDWALMVTVICFLDDVEAAFREVHRILRPAGFLILGFIDKTSPLGMEYERRKEESKFYREARLYSVDEVALLLKKAGFDDLSFAQTIFRGPGDIKGPEPVIEGYGKGSFVAVRARKGS